MKSAKRRKAYKSTDHWLEAVYRKNKKTIDEALDGVKNKKAAFKNAVKGYMEEGLSPEKALDTLERSTIFTPEKTRFRKNLLQALKEKGRYNDFRKMIRGEKGRFAKVILDKFQYDRKQNLYYYYTDLGDIVVIEFTNSPEDIILHYLGA